jgi:hypothetical protein
MNGLVCGRNRISLEDLKAARAAKRPFDEWSAGVSPVGSAR